MGRKQKYAQGIKELYNTGMAVSIDTKLNRIASKNKQLESSMPIWHWVKLTGSIVHKAHVFLIYQESRKDSANFHQRVQA